MKAIVFSFSLIILFCSVSCDKDEETVTEASFHAIKNGELWNSTASWANFTKSDSFFFISAAKADRNYNQGEQLYFRFSLPDISGSNTVTRFDSQWLYIVGGDAVSDQYLIDTTSDNQIVILSVDTVMHKIRGSFQVKLIRDKNRSDAGETMNFRSGWFDLIYTENNFND